MGQGAQDLPWFEVAASITPDANPLHLGQVILLADVVEDGHDVVG